MLGAPVALAQDAPGLDSLSDPGAALGIGQGEVAIVVEEFGLGNVVRAGSWAGLRMAITDRGVRQRELLLRLEVKDADGDTTWYERGLASNPGQRQEIWTYLRLPFRFDANERLLARVYEAEDTDSPTPRAGQLVGEAFLSPTAVVRPEVGLIGVIGSRPAGLTAYSDGKSEPYDSRLHEPTVVATRLEPSTMPDAWAGLSQYGVFVWTQGEPVTLGAGRADTLRGWVRQGGHLVVLLPQVGGTWFSGELNNPLFDIMPAVTTTRETNYPTGPIRPLLTTRSDVVLPATVVAHAFEIDPDAQGADDTSVLIRDPAGRAIVVRRHVGLGQVTFVGLDVGAEALARVGAPSPDSFWHRVLGRRGDLRPWSMRGRQVTEPSRSVRHFDHSVDATIAQTGSPASGVLLGFVVFIAYWLVAGPVGFAVLKKTGRARHAWVAFVGVTAVFTGLAWGGAVLLSPASVRGAHLTIIDHVYGQPVQRTRTWAGLIVPSYGESTLEVGVRAGGGDVGTFVATVSPWMSPDGGATIGSFPDNRGYRLLGARPSSMMFPVRSTMKELSVQWAGPTVWPMPAPVRSADGPGELRSTPRPVGIPASEMTSEAAGRLVHDLPGDLHDVVIIINHGMLAVQPGVSPNRPIMDASAFGLADAWAPGVELDLAAATRRTGTGDVSLRELLDDRGLQSVSGFQQITQMPEDDRSVSEQLVIASLISQIGAPPTSTARGADAYTAATRRVMHGLDLGVWMTEPCIIILGHLGVGPGEDGAPSPTPMTIDGRDPNLSGRTFVRWVYPLGDRPPAIMSTPAASTPAGTSELGSDGPGGGGLGPDF